MTIVLCCSNMGRRAGGATIRSMSAILGATKTGIEMGIVSLIVRFENGVSG